MCYKAHNYDQNKTGFITIAICGGSFHNLTVLNVNELRHPSLQSCHKICLFHITPYKEPIKQ